MCVCILDFSQQSLKVIIARCRGTYCYSRTPEAKAGRPGVQDCPGFEQDFVSNNDDGDDDDVM